MRWLPLVLALAGCNRICSVGLGTAARCESAWPHARVGIFTGEQMRRLERSAEPADAFTDATASIFGTLKTGSDWSLDARGNRIVVGMPDLGEVAVVFYDKDAKDLGPHEFKVEPNPERGELSNFFLGRDGFGTSVMTIDANGDQTPDLFVGGPEWPLGTERGAVWLFDDATQPQDVDTAVVRLVGDTEGDRFGTAMKVCSDLDGDGEPDYLITAPGFRAPAGPDTATADGVVLGDHTIEDLAGAVFLIESRQLLAQPLEGEGVSAWRLGRVWWGVGVGDGLGQSMLCDKDANGDGEPDIVLGAPFEGSVDKVLGNGEVEERGAVYILDGKILPPSGNVREAAWMRLASPWERAWFGFSVEVIWAGGTERRPDLLVGAPGADADGTGRVGLFLGDDYIKATRDGRVKANKNVEVAAEFLPEKESRRSTHFGRWLAVGRFDGTEDRDGDRELDPDRLQDIAIGAPDLAVKEGARRFSHDAGGVWIHLGKSRDNWFPRNIVGQHPHDIELVPSQPFQRVGRGMIVADPDGDGFDDLLFPMRTSYRK